MPQLWGASAVDGFEPKPWPAQPAMAGSNSGPWHLNLLFRVLGRWVSVVRQGVLPRQFPGLGPYLFRLALFVVAFPVFALLQCMHLIGLVLDHVLFADFRSVTLRRPVFILGAPRSGTTHMHHLLSKDPGFTTFSLWELLFAPSISERHLYKLLGRLDTAVGAPVSRGISWAEQRLANAMKDIHPIGLKSPEEDFLLLLPTLDCFLLVLVFPECDWLWRLARSDGAGKRQPARVVLRRYRRLLQRHIYFHGRHLQLLSKNASFAGLAQSLVSEFPDSAIVVCERDAVLAVKSQMRSLHQCRRLLALDKLHPTFQQKLLETLQFYYKNLQRLKVIAPANQLCCVALHDLSLEPRQTLQSLYQQLRLGNFDDVKPLLETLMQLESNTPTRPKTTNSNNVESGDVALEFSSFSNWRHAPERRL